MNHNGDFLGRRQRPSRAKASSAAARPRETGRDPLAADYERGPFADLAVPELPAGALALLERRTGTRTDPAVIAEWERIRAFTGYAGVEVDARTAARMATVDPKADREGVTVAPPRPRRATLRDPPARAPLVGADAPDPEDLGGD